MIFFTCVQVIARQQQQAINPNIRSGLMIVKFLTLIVKFKLWVGHGHVWSKLTKQ
jgi:hypothetical protein